MHPVRRRRLMLVLVLLCGVGAAAALTLTALNENINHFYSPSEVVEGKAPAARTFRLGGLVLEGSVKRDPASLGVEFVVTDRFQETRVRYEGILPDLFREGQSVITIGQLEPGGVFRAREINAKHDESYMPREVKEAMDKAKAAGKAGHS